MTNLISLGLGESHVSRDPQDVLVAYGLGSCLGVCMIDPQARVAGLLHAVLPEQTSALDPNSSAPAAKYVNRGIESLLADMLKEGAIKSRIVVHMVGGANMLISLAATSAFDIGTRNIEKARETFKRLGMKIAAEEVGGHKGRTVRVYVADCRITVKQVGETEHEMKE